MPKGTKESKSAQSSSGRKRHKKSGDTANAAGSDLSDADAEVSEAGSDGPPAYSLENLSEEQVEQLQDHLRSATDAMGRLTHKQKEYCTAQYLEKLENERVQDGRFSALSQDDGAEDDGDQANEGVVPEKRRSPRKSAPKLKIKHSAMAQKANGLAAASDSDDDNEPKINNKLFKKLLAALQTAGAGVTANPTAIIAVAASPIGAARASASLITSMGK